MPLAKGKQRRTEVEADHDLEARMTDAQTKKARPTELRQDSAGVSAAALIELLSETMSRVYGEIWPNMTVRDSDDRVDIEIAEEAYIVGLMIEIGSPHVMPRKPIKVRDAEISSDARYCSNTSRRSPDAQGRRQEHRRAVALHS